MLTKDDFKQIRVIIREEIEAENQNLKNELQSDLLNLKVRIVTETKEISDRLKNLEIVANYLRKSLKKAVNFLDRDYLKLKGRVDDLEELSKN